MITTSPSLFPGEVLGNPEVISRQRLPYGAVPLDPWHARTDHESSLYSVASIKRIERNLRNTMIEQDWFRGDDRGHQLYTLMRDSLLSSHFARIERNNAYGVEDQMDEGDPRVFYARRGLATPAELFELLIGYPKRQSIELAKLSHPFDFAASNDMDRAMDELLLLSGGELLDEDPRYDLKRIDPEIPAGVLLRKQDLMDLKTEHGTLRVVERRGLLVYQGVGMDDERHFDRLLKNPKNKTALHALTEQYLYEPDKHLYGWVQPQATSYYAKYITTPAPRV